MVAQHGLDVRLLLILIECTPIFVDNVTIAEVVVVSVVGAAVTVDVVAKTLDVVAGLSKLLTEQWLMMAMRW